MPCFCRRLTLADQALQRARGLLQLSGFQLDTGNAELGPGCGACLAHRFVEGAGLVELVQAHVQLGPDTGCVQPVLAALLEALLADLCSGRKVFLGDRLEDRAQHLLAVPRLQHALFECRCGVGLEQVAVQRRLGGLGDVAIGGLAGHHHENGGVGQQVGAAQVVEQVLPGHHGVVEVVVAQHHVEAAVLEQPARVHRSAGVGHVAHPHRPQHPGEDAARGHVAVDDERTAVADVGIQQASHAGVRKSRNACISARPGCYLNRSLTRSVQLLAFGECLSPPLRKDSSSSFSSLRWCSVSLIGVSTCTWQYRSPG